MLLYLTKWDHLLKKYWQNLQQSEVVAALSMTHVNSVSIEIKIQTYDGEDDNYTFWNMYPYILNILLK